MIPGFKNLDEMMESNRFCIARKGSKNNKFIFFNFWVPSLITQIVPGSIYSKRYTVVTIVHIRKSCMPSRVIYHNELNSSIFVLWIKNAQALLYQANRNAYYIKLRWHFMSLEEEFHKLEYGIWLLHFQSIVKKNKDSKDAKMNRNAKQFLTVSGKAIS